MSIITSWLTNMAARVHVIFRKKLLKKSNLPIVTYTSSYLFLKNLEPFYPLTKALVNNNSFWTSHAITSYKYLIHMATSSIYRYPSNLFTVSQYKCSTISLICIPERQSRYWKTNILYHWSISMNMSNAHIMKMPSKTLILFYFFKIFNL